MKPTPVSRFYFSQDEVVASLFPSGIPSKSVEFRLDGDELIVDFVDPKADPLHDTHTHKGVQPSDDHERPAPDPADDYPGGRPSPSDKQEDRPAAKVGQNEIEARDLCAQRGFQTFLEVRTEEAALKVLLDKCKAPDLRSLDTEKYKKAAFRDVVADYELWLRG